MGIALHSLGRQRTTNPRFVLWYLFAWLPERPSGGMLENPRRNLPMRKRIAVLILAMAQLAVPRASNRLWGQAEKKDAMPDPSVKVGDMAPDFTLMDTHRNQVSLHDFRGKKSVALAFYIFAFTGG
jgi:AhpC/TSA family